MTRCLLSDERLAREKSTKGRRRLLDSHLTGFQVVITSRSKTFIVRTARLYRVLGRWPLLTCEEARQRAYELLRRLVAGQDLHIAVPRTRIPTLRQAFEKYLAGKNLKPKSVVVYREVMRNQATELLDLPLSAITTDLYTEAFRRIKAPSRANLHAALVGAIYNYMDAIVGVKLPNPATSMRRVLGLHALTPRSRIIRDDQQRAWYQAIEALENRVAADLLVALALTGTRRDELRLLDCSLVNLEKRLIHLPDTKTGRPHTLPFGKRLHALLKRRFEAQNGVGRVFPIGEDMVYRNAQKAINTSGVQFSPHDLRRGFATIASKLIGDELLVKALLNHAPVGVTQKHYIIRDVGELIAPMQRIEDYIFGLWDG